MGAQESEPSRPDMAGLEIRAAGLADAESIGRLWALPGYRNGTLRMPFEDPAGVRKSLEALNENRVLIVAVRAGLVIGTAGWNRPSRARRSHSAGIGLGVHYDHVGQGVGTALLTALVDAADRWYAIRRLELEVFADNAPAIGLYRKFGFEVEGTLRGYAFADGRYADALAMARIRPG